MLFDKENFQIPLIRINSSESNYSPEKLKSKFSNNSDTTSTSTKHSSNSLTGIINKNEIKFILHEKDNLITILTNEKRELKEEIKKLQATIVELNKDNKILAQKLNVRNQSGERNNIGVFFSKNSSKITIDATSVSEDAYNNLNHYTQNSMLKTINNISNLNNRMSLSDRKFQNNSNSLDNYNEKDFIETNFIHRGKIIEFNKLVKNCKSKSNKSITITSPRNLNSTGIKISLNTKFNNIFSPKNSSVLCNYMKNKDNICKDTHLNKNDYQMKLSELKKRTEKILEEYNIILTK